MDRLSPIEHAGSARWCAVACPSGSGSPSPIRRPWPGATPAMIGRRFAGRSDQLSAGDGARVMPVLVRTAATAGESRSPADRCRRVRRSRREPSGRSQSTEGVAITARGCQIRSWLKDSCGSCSRPRVPGAAANASEARPVRIREIELAGRRPAGSDAGRCPGRALDGVAGTREASPTASKPSPG